MNTLLLRLAGPMQAWGVQSRFDHRDTGREPSKSGVIGLLCAALGRPRDADITDLAALRMGVRVDREGAPAVDYQTAQNIVRASGGSGGMVQSWRHYLAGAVFLVGLAGDDATLLEKIDAALDAPVWPLFLGRKAYPPGAPVRLPDGLRRGADLEDALQNYPWLTDGPPAAPVRLVMDSGPDSPGASVRLDQPISFAGRRFHARYVAVQLKDVSWFAAAKEERNVPQPPHP